jgi:hypothetical protein
MSSNRPVDDHRKQRSILTHTVTAGIIMFFSFVLADLIVSWIFEINRIALLQHATYWIRQLIVAVLCGAVYALILSLRRT